LVTTRDALSPLPPITTIFMIASIVRPRLIRVSAGESLVSWGGPGDVVKPRLSALIDGAQGHVAGRYAAPSLFRYALASAKSIASRVDLSCTLLREGTRKD